MKKAKKIFTLASLVFVLAVLLIFGVNIYNENTWIEREKIGFLNEVILFHQFPNHGLLITFKGGEFLYVTQNYLGSYAYLSQLEEWARVEIKYKENLNRKIWINSLEEIGMTNPWVGG